MMYIFGFLFIFRQKDCTICMNNFFEKGVLKMTDMENFEEKEQYRGKIIELVEKIDNGEVLKRIYELAQYLYVYKEK